MSIVETVITDVPSMLGVLRLLTDDFGRAELWYRGHAQSNWTLTPAIYREPGGRRREATMCQLFRLRAPTRFAACPDFDDIAGWLSLMQHYGLSTRLLDWSASPLAALYFAVEHERSPGDGALWMFIAGQFNAHVDLKAPKLPLLNNRDVRPLVEEAFDQHKPATPKIVAVYASELDLRMSVQQGTFTIHGDATPIEAKPDVEKYLAKMVIPEASKPNIRAELLGLGIRRSMLFPDLHHLAQELRLNERFLRLDVSSVDTASTEATADEVIASATGTTFTEG